MPNWWGSIKAIIASVLAVGGGLAVAVGGAWEKLSRSVEVGFWDAVYAAFTPVLPLAGSVAAILGFVATMAQLFGPKPATKDDVEDVAERHGDATRIRVSQEHENTRSHQSIETDRAIEAINRDKHEQAIADLQAGNASDNLKARYLKALGIVRSDGSTVSPREAAEFALAASRAAQSDDPRIREIAELIDQGRIVEASDRKAAIAEESVQSAARELRDAASLALPISPSKALEHLERATVLDPEHFWSWIGLGQLRAAYDSLDSSELAFRNGLQRVVEAHDRMVVHGAFGDLLMVRGQLKNAREEFEAALAINEQLAGKEPNNAEWRRDLSLIYDRLGDLEVAADNLTAARDRFEAGLAIRERLTQQDPGNSEWQRNLSVSYNKLGDVEVATGNPTAARDRFEASLAIVERLTQQEPGNSEWQRDLSVSYNKLGDVEIAADNLTAARDRFEASLAIRERLAQQEPDNSQWQRDLSISHMYLGDVELAAENFNAARDRFEASLAIRERLAQQDPGNNRWQRDLSASHSKLGEVELAAGNLTAARDSFGSGLAIAERLARQEPGNSQWQSHLSISHIYLGEVELAAENFTAARERFEAGLAIAERLSQQDPGNSKWRRDLSFNLERLGDTETAVEPEPRLHTALECFRRASDIRWEIARRNPDCPQFWAELALPLMRRYMVSTWQDDEAALGNLALELRELTDYWQQQSFESDPRIERACALLAINHSGEDHDS